MLRFIDDYVVHVRGPQPANLTAMTMSIILQLLLWQNAGTDSMSAAAVAARERSAIKSEKGMLPR